MNDEQTIPTDTEGEKVDTPVESSDAEYARLKERNNKIQEELIRGEKLKTESLLGGDTGGHIASKELTEDEKKKSRPIGGGGTRKVVYTKRINLSAQCNGTLKEFLMPKRHTFCFGRMGNSIPNNI